MSKYTDDDLENLIALCDQEENPSPQAIILKKRCEQALAYADCSLRITRKDKELLQDLFDPDMDPEAKATLNKCVKK